MNGSVPNVHTEVPIEEARLALVLNGGVSLAVWMGGVSHEINRLTRAKPRSAADSGDVDQRALSGYAPILDIARTRISVDIISGTSAGGINGAALALAQANENADLRTLRGLWAEQGRMEVLLRKPFQGSPTSMLRGDDYFLPELQRAMLLLAAPYKQGEFATRSRVPGKNYVPVDLTLTTTLLKGQQSITVDDFGERIPQRLHAATFRFSNLSLDESDPGDGFVNPTFDESDIYDLFDEKHIEATARAMALGCRCTASFPFAFEPSFVPVHEREGTDRNLRPDDLRPDMARFASWTDHTLDNQSRYAVDGGVLANTPLAHALDAIRRRPVSGPARRVMLLVFPHAPKAEDDVPPDEETNPPSAVGALAGVLGALQSQGSRSFIEKVVEHNRQAADWRGGRDQILIAFGREGVNPVEAVYKTLGASWPLYQHIRIRLAARGLADKVPSVEHWSYERIREAAESAQREWLHGSQAAAPAYLPYIAHDQALEPPGPGVPPHWLAWVTRPQEWLWGDAAALGVGDAAAAALRAAVSVAPAALKVPLAEAQELVGLQVAVIHAQRRDLDAIWTTNEFLLSQPPDKGYWTARIAAYGLAMVGRRDIYANTLETWIMTAQGDPLSGPAAEALNMFNDRNGEHGRAVSSAAYEIASALAATQTVLNDVAESSVGSDEVSGLRRWTSYLFADVLDDDEPPDDSQRLLLRLLMLDAATRLISEGTTRGANLPVKLGELSLRLRHPWAHLSTEPDDKAAGLELARFGGFLKRSWRMNDWTWGRLDAITLLCQVVLDPKRLRRVSTMIDASSPASQVAPDQLFAILEHDLYGESGESALPLELRPTRARAHAEFIDAMTPGAAEREHLPELAAWAAFPLQAEVILEELPVLASAIRLDVQEGAGTSTNGTRLLELIEREHGLLAEVTALTRRPGIEPAERLRIGHQALKTFDAAGIGREPLSGETGSDALIRTASNAAGVLATVLDSDANKAPAAKPITSAVRGAMMLPYWIINGLSGGGPIARFLATVGLVLGGVLLTLSLFGVLGSFAPAAAAAGTGALLAALAYSVLKTGSLLHACVLLAPVGPVVAWALMSQEDARAAATRVIIVLCFVAALYVLANIPWPLRAPLAVLLDVADGIKANGWRDPILDRALVLVGAALLAAWFRRDLMRAAEWVWERMEAPNGWWLTTAVAVILVVGMVQAYVQGAFLRVWRPASDTITQYHGTSGTAHGRFTRRRVDAPEGVAAAWAPCYAIGYFLAGWAFWSLSGFGSGKQCSDNAWINCTWELFTFWWLVAVGIVLCLVAPFALTRRPRRRLLRLLLRTSPLAASANWSPTTPGVSGFDADDGAPPQLRPANEPQQLLHELLKHDSAYCYLTRGGTSRGRFRPRGVHRKRATALHLTVRGSWLVLTLQRHARGLNKQARTSQDRDRQPSS